MSKVLDHQMNFPYEWQQMTEEEKLSLVKDRLWQELDDKEAILPLPVQVGDRTAE